MEPEQEETSSLPGLLAALASGARAVHSLPLEDDFSFEASFPEFAKSLTETQEDLLQTLLVSLQYTSSAKEGIDNDILDPDGFQDIQDPLLWDACADACEELLDQVEAFLQSKSTIVDDDNVALATGNLANLAGRARQKAKSSLGRLVESTVEMEKPQVTYSLVVTTLNDRKEPFIPKIHPEKPFSVEPLDMSLQSGHGLDTRHGPLRKNARVPPDVVAPSQHVPHLYEKEITSFQYTPQQLEARKPEGDIATPPSLDATWVDTPQALQELSQKLEHVQEVAVDLEHHSYRSFAGLLCLMQISFRNPGNNNDTMENFLVDVFPLWKEINNYLAPMFANPAIVKVMHGADSDIQWLQRDFGIYVVNLFDTGRAARALGLPSAGLAFCLQKYANVQADKTHQLSDWRQRPIPDAMRQYAIMDTHYLLDIYDRIKWDVQQSKNTSIEEVLNTSRKVCLVRYTKDPFYPSGYKSLTKQRSGGRQQTVLNAQQEQVLEKLWDWRDQTGRNTDESPTFIGSNAVLMRIALSCPTTVTALQALLNPIPPLILHYATAVTQIVRKVRTNMAIDTRMEGNDLRGKQQQPAVGAPSSAFFKPAELSSDDRIRRAGVLSPVLGTEALYKQAGWITPSGAREENEVRRTLMRRLVEEQEIEPMVTTTEEEGGAESDAVDASGAPMMPTKPKKGLSVNRSNRDYKTQQQTSHSLGMGKDSADGKNAPTGKPRARTADGIGPARAAREHSHSPVPPLTMEEEVKNAQQTAALIRSGMSQKKEMLGLISPPDEEDLDAEDEAPRAASGPGADDNFDESERDLAASSKENDEEFVIPRSMTEIYKISNRNRRNKKTGSPTSDRQTFPTTDAEMEHLAKAEQLLKERGLAGKGYFDSPGGSKRQRTKSAGTEQDDGAAPGSTENASTLSREDDVAFMQDIGWIKSKEDADRLLGQDESAPHGDSGPTANPDAHAADEDHADDDAVGTSGGKGSRDSKTPTFDYSSVAGVGTMSGAAVSNPFFTGAAIAGGPLTHGGTNSKSDRKKSGSGKGGKQGRNRQERPEKRDGKTHAYRKR
ncbi:Exosome component 10 [Seminavis robusta]|uniref:Exosome component 10 n=1 Tax=Seminavis robusta TaxID=568900 RepID=A0A9N8HL43_9STRA|nr:Exosome component 10 [Seminavis robusta]|eukprot:Sro998_g229560.1 Exosome component 10 (1058) ;mRNA; f:31546-34719